MNINIIPFFYMSLKYVRYFSPALCIFALSLSLVYATRLRDHNRERSKASQFCCRSRSHHWNKGRGSSVV